MLETVTFSNHSISMHTECPINRASEGNHYIYVIVDHFKNYIITVPSPKDNDQFAVQ